MKDTVALLASSMGLVDFRTGPQTLRDARGWRSGEIHLTHAWHAYILPSFHDHAVIAVARTSETEFHGHKFPAFFRAGIAIVSLGQVTITNIEFDPLPDAFSSLTLFAADKSAWLDGIGYELHVDSSTCHATLQFSNPSVSELRSIETSFCQIGDTIAKQSNDPTVADYLKMWKSYIADREPMRPS